MKILLQRRHGLSHEEVDVTICWDGISEEDIKFLASQCLIHNLKAKVKAGFYQNSLPEFIEIMAAWEVHHGEPESGHLLLNAPKAWKSGEDKVKVKVEKISAAEEFEAQLSKLSAAERAALFATL